jgi:membrane protein
MLYTELMTSVPTSARPIAQRFLFAAERFGEHELANHAAAGAYAFLLSATPAALIALGLASTVLNASPGTFAEAERLATGMLGPLDLRDVVRAFFGKPLGGFAAVVGAASLMWAVRLFVVTIQRAFHVVWSGAAKKTLYFEGVLSFAIELVAIFCIVAMFAAAEATRMLADSARTAVWPLAGKTLASAARAAPAFVLFFVVALTYYMLPSKRPHKRVAALNAALCVASFAVFAALFRAFIGTERYDLLYGVIGSLIILLVNVYTFFSLYFYFAELCYVEEHFDALLFGRFHKLSRPSPGAGSKIERALFMEPERLFASYGRKYGAGEHIFVAGERGESAYFVHRGRVGIFLSGEDEGRKIADCGPGEVFGEMAYILQEPRTATARAEEDSIVLELPPSIFELYLRSTPEASRQLIGTLSERLKGANDRLNDDELWRGD